MAIANIQNEKTRLQNLIQKMQIEKANEDLKEAARSKKDFIANVTHELRTPLTLIRGWTDYILQGESGKVPEKLLGIINKVDLQTLNLTQKINELLKVSKFDAGMETLILTKTDINASIFQIVTSFKGITDKSGIDLNYLSKTKIKDIFIDMEKFKDILNNLIRNAYKFTEKGEIKVTLAQADDLAIIQVKDTGIGMSQKVIKNIFQRFQQGDSSKTRKYEGTGLGLAIVQDSVKIMHGTISVKSLENRGTTFTIKLPMDIEKREPDFIKERRVEDRRTKLKSLGPDDRRQKDRRVSDLAKIDERDIVKISRSEKTFSSETT
ncbi:MAG: HAMP domain-containing sensor histidine kinase, partial [Desulfobacula sp.]|nr:HAMP domain-containing sensor histidine kinase [Desulfobacula sp.]